MNDVLTLRSPQDLGEAMFGAIASGEMQAIEPPVEHYFADGLYGRRIFVQAGTCVVTKKHLQQHITVALTGYCTVVDERGNKQEVTAPGVWVTEAGAQRSVYCHTDVEWLTCHHTELKTVDEVETALVEDTFAEARKLLGELT